LSLRSRLPPNQAVRRMLAGPINGNIHFVTLVLFLPRMSAPIPGNSLMSNAPHRPSTQTLTARSSPGFKKAGPRGPAPQPARCRVAMTSPGLNVQRCLKMVAIAPPRTTGKSDSQLEEVRNPVSSFISPRGRMPRISPRIVDLVTIDRQIPRTRTQARRSKDFFLAHPVVADGESAPTLRAFKIGSRADQIV